MASASKLIDLSLAAFGEAVAGEATVPGGGAVSGSLGMFGTGLLSMAFRHAAREGVAEFPAYMEGRADEFDSLRARFAELVDADADAYAAFRKAQDQPPSEERDVALSKSLLESITVPIEIAEAAMGALRISAVGVDQVDEAHVVETRFGVETLVTAARGALGLARSNVTHVQDDAVSKEHIDLLDFLDGQLEEYATFVRNKIDTTAGADA